MPDSVTSDHSRHLPLPGTYNVRDIGGYRTRDGHMTRWRTLFRADSLHRLPAQAQTVLLGHGVRTVIDLRRTDELAVAPNVFTAATGVTYRHMSLLPDKRPVMDEPRSLLDMYRYMLDERQEQIRLTLQLLSTPGGLPGLVHCTAGKDRTGVIMALVLALAGVPEETIIADYALSATYLSEPFREEVRQRVLADGYAWEKFAPLLGCPPEYMQATLQYLHERYGGIETYVQTIGLSTAEMTTLRTTLVR
jgi:protein-tyrosine phosphatase